MASRKCWFFFFSSFRLRNANCVQSDECTFLMTITRKKTKVIFHLDEYAYFQDRVSHLLTFI